MSMTFELRMSGQFSLNVIKTDNQLIKKYYKELINKKDEISQQMENYEVDKELIEAERDVERAINLKLHANEIYNKPKK